MIFIKHVQDILMDFGKLSLDLFPVALDYRNLGLVTLELHPFLTTTSCPWIHSPFSGHFLYNIQKVYILPSMSHPNSVSPS
jgi:hypothetical protein